MKYVFPRRDALIYVIINFFSLGIFGYYWMYCICKDILNSGVDNEFSPGMTVFLSIITFGIYGWYWAYNMGEICNRINIENGMKSQDQSTTFLILSLLGLQIVNLVLIQQELNKWSYV